MHCMKMSLCGCEICLVCVDGSQAHRAPETWERFWSPPSALVLGLWWISGPLGDSFRMAWVTAAWHRSLPSSPTHWEPRCPFGPGLVAFTLETWQGTFEGLCLTFRSHSAAYRDPLVTSESLKSHCNYFGTLLNYRWWLLVCVWIQLIKPKARELNHDRITAVATTITIKLNLRPTFPWHSANETYGIKQTNKKQKRRKEKKRERNRCEPRTQP